MKFITFFIALVFVVQAFAADSVILSETSRSRTSPKEGMFLFISAKGQLMSDSGTATFGELGKTFKRWRSMGAEPGVRLILFPSLKSNSNLETIKGIIDFLKREKVGYDILLMSKEAKPDADLQ